MSYDLYIDDEDFNITYNVAGMFYSCFKKKGIRHIYGMTGEQSIRRFLNCTGTW